MELTPPWDLIPLVNRESLLFPPPTMEALTQFFTDSLPGSSSEEIVQVVEQYLQNNPAITEAIENAIQEHREEDTPHEAYDVRIVSLKSLFNNRLI